MIDFNKIKDKVIQNKILIPNEDISVEYKPIVFFIDNDEIVYVGKTEKKVLEYVFNRSKQIKCTHYFTELVNIDDIDNIIAELILTLKPIYHNKISPNTKYISNNNAKKLYHIDKREFRKYWNNSIGLKLGNTLFLEKRIFDDIFAIPEAFSIDMPKVGTFINEKEDSDNRPLYINRDLREYESYKDKDGNWIEKIIRINLSKGEEKEESKMSYNNLKILIQHAYCVTNIINSKEFEAYSEYKNKKQIFNVSEQTWKKLPNQFLQDEIIHRYLESLES